jgi:hypothetical protein
MPTTLTMKDVSSSETFVSLIRLISNPIQAPSHEFDEMEIKIPPINIVDIRNFVGLLGIREESYTLWMGYEPISLNLTYFFYFTLYFYLLLRKQRY